MYCPSSDSRIGINNPVTGSISVIGSLLGGVILFSGTGGGSGEADTGIGDDEDGGRSQDDGAERGGEDGRAGCCSILFWFGWGEAGFEISSFVGCKGECGGAVCLRRGDLRVSGTGGGGAGNETDAPLPPRLVLLLVPLITSSIVSSTVVLEPSRSWQKYTD